MKTLQDLLTNLKSGAMLAFMLPVTRYDFRAGVGQIIALVAISTAISLGYDYAIAGPARVFNPVRPGNDAILLIAFLVGCFAAARLQRRPELFGLLTTAILSAMPSVSLVYLLTLELSRSPFAQAGGPIALVIPWLWYPWVIVVALRVFRKLFDVRLGRALLAAAVYGACAFTPQFLVPWMEYGYWYEGTGRAQAASQKTRHRVNVEETYYEQRALMDEALDGVRPERPGVTDLYFVGFAGDASQDVFIKEVTSVTQLFDRRFDTAGRSLKLINHRTTLDTMPLANAPNLAAALQGIASKMNADEDVLFLFLTSHGSRKHELYINFPGLRPNDLPADDLGRILDLSGIKWRVIVISACYSGGFIDSLKDEYTLIMTAARRDRTSFGCGNAFDFTYFGEAYFDQALRKTFSFTEAFEQARAAIATRERAEDLTPSKPQIFAGAAIRAKLAALEGRFTDIPTARQGSGLTNAGTSR